MSASEEDTLVGECKELDSQIISRLALVILGGNTAYTVFLYLIILVLYLFETFTGPILFYRLMKKKL